MENNQKTSNFAIFILILLFILGFFRLFFGKNVDKTEKLNERKSLKRRILKSLSILFAFANIPLIIFTFTIDKIDSIPFVQAILIPREYCAAKALQQLTSDGVINYESEGFYEFRYYAIEEIKKSPMFIDNEFGLLKNYPIFYVFKEGTAISENGVFRLIVFRSLCCNFHLSFEQISQRIDQAKKDSLFEWAKLFLLLNVLSTSLSVIFSSLLAKE